MLLPKRIVYSAAGICFIATVLGMWWQITKSGSPPGGITESIPQLNRFGLTGASEKSQPESSESYDLEKLRATFKLYSQTKSKAAFSHLLSLCDDLNHFTLAEALEVLGEIENSGIYYKALAQVVRYHASMDADVVAAWYTDNASVVEADTGVRDALGTGWGFAGHVPPAKLLTDARFLRYYFEKLHAAHPELTEIMLQKIEEPFARDGAMVGLVFSTDDIAAKQAYLSSIQDGDARIEVLNNISIATTDHLKTIKWVTLSQSLRESERLPALSNQVSAWYYHDARGVSEWITQQPTGTIRDHATSILAQRLSRSSVSDALAWADTISAPELREKVMAIVQKRKKSLGP